MLECDCSMGLGRLYSPQRRGVFYMLLAYIDTESPGLISFGARSDWDGLSGHHGDVLISCLPSPQSAVTDVAVTENAHFISCERIARVHYRCCKSTQRTGWMSGSALSGDHAFNSAPPSHYSVWWCGSKYSKSCAGHSFSERGFCFPMPRHSRPLYHQSDPTWWIHPVESNCHEM